MLVDSNCTLLRQEHKAENRKESKICGKVTRQRHATATEYTIAGKPCKAVGAHVSPWNNSHSPQSARAYSVTMLSFMPWSIEHRMNNDNIVPLQRQQLEIEVLLATRVFGEVGECRKLDGRTLQYITHTQIKLCNK